MTIHQHRCQRLMRVSIPVPEGAGPRACLEAQISLLISLLDYMDPDPDLEENGDLEPSLGHYIGAEPDAELDISDNEPCLGSSPCGNQEHWSQGIDEDYDDDAEHDCDDDTDNTDDTPIFWGYVASDTERQVTAAASARLLATANRLRGVEVRP